MHITSILPGQLENFLSIGWDCELSSLNPEKIISVYAFMASSKIGIVDENRFELQYPPHYVKMLITSVNNTILKNVNKTSIKSLPKDQRKDARKLFKDFLADLNAPDADFWETLSSEDQDIYSDIFKRFYCNLSDSLGKVEKGTSMHTSAYNMLHVLIAISKHLFYDAKGEKAKALFNQIFLPDDELAIN